MGNTQPVTPFPVGTAPEPVDEQQNDDSYKWPENLYVEARDMMAVSFLVFSFGYILETARRFPDEFDGLEVDSGEGEPNSTQAPKTGQAINSNACDKALARSFSPSDVVDLIENNAEILASTFGSQFKDPTACLTSLKLLQERIDAVPESIERPITLEEFDDKHQKHELVYGVAVDRINKRITLGFRGTENELSFGTNWSTNLSLMKRAVRLPPYFEGKTSTETVKLHSGFYKYLFELTFDDSDDPDTRKYDEIVKDVLRVLGEHPGYKVCITGHSLGGALASMVAFFFASDARFPKPITCFTAGAPRIGDPAYADAVQVLERNRKLRYCRVVNKNDYVAFVPIVGYQHAGFQVRLSRDEGESVEVQYPKKNDTWAGSWGRTWGNSLFTNTNLGYDHGDYRERVDQNQSWLENLNLDKLYQNSDFTGWRFE